MPVKKPTPKAAQKAGTVRVRPSKPNRTSGPNPLPWQVKAYVMAILKGQTQRAAALAAGYQNGPAIDVLACKLRKHPMIHEALERAALDALLDLRVMSKEELIQQTSARLRLDPSLLYTPEGELKNIHDMPAQARRFIDQIETVSRNIGTDDGVVETVLKVKLTPYTEARKAMMQVHGLERQVHEHTFSVQALNQMSDEEFEAYDRETRELYERQKVLRQKMGLLPPTETKEPKK